MRFVVELGLKKRALTVLGRANARTVVELVAMTEHQVINLPQCGRKTLNDILAALKRERLKFRAVR